MTEKVYIAGALRTPFGNFGGALKDIEVETLAAMLIKGLIERSKIQSDEVDAVHLGCCVMFECKDAGGPVIARQALLKAGLPAGVISSTVDKACCSATEAIRMAYDSIRLGEADVVIAGGVEVMSRIPHIARNLRWGKKLGHCQLEDPVFPVGYKDYNPVAVDAGEVAVEYGVSREEQDLWAYTSQQRYQAAQKAEKFKAEIMPVELKDKKKNTVIFHKDEFPKAGTTLEGLAKLQTIYGSPTVTAGNAPGLNDGAAALLLVCERKLKELGLEPLAEIITVACVADSPRYIAKVPALAINKALQTANLGIDDVKRIEINEAFAAVPLVSSKILGDFNEEKVKMLREKLNVNGGAIAIGHPVGASGARITMTLMYELRRLGGGYGVAAICGGLAQGDAVMIRV